MKNYKKCTAEKYSFLVNDTNLPSNNLLSFRKNILQNERWKMNINKEAAKMSALSSGKINKYKYLAGQEILSFNQK